MKVLKPTMRRPLQEIPTEQSANTEDGGWRVEDGGWMPPQLGRVKTWSSVVSHNQHLRLQTFKVGPVCRISRLQPPLVTFRCPHVVLEEVSGQFVVLHGATCTQILHTGPNYNFSFNVFLSIHLCASPTVTQSGTFLFFLPETLGKKQHESWIIILLQGCPKCGPRAQHGQSFIHGLLGLSDTVRLTFG
ncbi:hypothetical protein E3U43_009434 [Larimichthys crocea]|uniref:Uncharacterized protein n=1 Tax=Larimichthys crocea TaxID=215358 RepID=A0ACD3QB91_LARCR|nr:hypothetical protein E3U43_009434 [Larimichthys crocea]